ncbi:MAG TPA: hypothetical protein VI913_03845 [Candidatus Peribacteraceae bacterium]|nr:hypothetical protein [Candidatus Peribacteraceae bacterium]
MRFSNPDLDCLRFHTEINGDVKKDCPTPVVERIFGETDLTQQDIGHLLFGKEEVRTVILDDGTVISCSNASATTEKELQGKFVRCDDGRLIPLDEAANEIYALVAPVSQRFPADTEMKEMTRLSLKQRLIHREEIWFMGQMYQLEPEPESQAQAA